MAPIRRGGGGGDMTSDDPDFYASIPVFDDFADAVKAENYRPLPDGWVVGFSDVVGSTAAIAQGRYKAVNMVGAGVIAAVIATMLLSVALAGLTESDTFTALAWVFHCVTRLLASAEPRPVA